MDGVATVVLGLEETEVAEEVMHFLDRSGGARVVATAGDRRQLDEAVRQLEPDAVVASPAVVAGLGVGTSVLLAIDTAESVRGLRAAIAAGARGFFVWPADRDALAGATARLATDADREPSRGGAVWTVFGPRGGTGATSVACNLAAALAVGGERSVVLADLDLAFGDCTSALGIDDPTARTLADLVPVLAELRPRHVEGVLRPHPAGFRVLLAPTASARADASDAVALDGLGTTAVLESLRSIADRVVVHVPRGFDAPTRAALAGAARVGVVLHPDVLSLRAARHTFEATGIAPRSVAVVTATRRGEVGLADVERVLGCPAIVIPADPAAPAAQDRGELVALRGRTGRAFRDLIAALEARA
ncbi:MAG: CpaE family protein [Actinomycetota bacterium]